MRASQLWLLVCVIVVCSFGRAIAAAPDRQELESSVVVVRQHSFWPDWIDSEGIWAFDPETFEYRRLRHILFFPGRTGPMVHDWGFLGADGDRLILQAWPDDLTFDLFTMRMINRLPVGDAGVAIGWAMQGPVLDSEDLAGTGLASGRYGLARCVTNRMSYLDGTCDEITLPGGTEPLTVSDDRQFFFDIENKGSVLSSEPIFEFGEPFAAVEAQIHSFDNERGGFWRGTKRGVRFYPAFEGAIQPFSFELDFSSLVGDLGDNWPEWQLGTFMYHQNSEKMFGLLRFLTTTNLGVTSEKGRVFFTVDAEGESFDVLQVGTTNENTGLPAWFGHVDNAPTRYEQIIPIVADIDGENGTHWITDLWFFNPANSTISVEISRLSNGLTKTIQIPSHASRLIENALWWAEGGPAGDGVGHDALKISSPYHWGKQLNVVGRMWTFDSVSGGTYGHTVPAVPAPYGYSNHQEVITNEMITLHDDSHIDLDLREKGRYRHNIGITNVLDESISVDLHWGWSEAFNPEYDPFKPDYLKQTITVAPKSIVIVRPEDLFDEGARGWPPRIAVVSNQPALIWFSIVDNISGDATFIPYTNYPYITGSPEWIRDDPNDALRITAMFLPVATSSLGRNGAIWKTDLVGYRGDGPNLNYDRPYMAFWPSFSRDSCSSNNETVIVERLDGEMGITFERWLQTQEEIEFNFPGPLEPSSSYLGWRSIYPDIIHMFEECADAQNISGALEIVTGSWFSGFSRTYTTREDGGTYGAMLPLYPPNGWPVQHFAGLELNEQTRINLGFFNGDRDHAITHVVTLYAEDGTQVAERTFSLDPLASKQLAIENFFKAVELAPGTYGLTVLPLDQEPAGENPGYQGHSWAYVSVIDNLTNDPINLW